MNDKEPILVADDREEDIIILQKAFKEGDIHNSLFTVRNGDEAINYLSGIGRFSDRTHYPLPVLLLLDLKMPGTDGFEVLRWIRTRPELVGMRVVVLTSSENMRDVTTAYQLGATSFLVKPLDFADTIAMAKTMTQYWLGMNVSPGIQPKPSKAPGPVSSPRNPNGTA